MLLWGDVEMRRDCRVEILFIAELKTTPRILSNLADNISNRESSTPQKERKKERNKPPTHFRRRVI